MQCLHDETRTAFNALVEELGSRSAASQLGAAAPDGLSGSTVQALIKELAEAIGALGGSVEIEGTALADYVAAAVKDDVLSGYYTGLQVEEKLEALGVDELESRVTGMESAFSQDGLMLGEVVREFPFTMPAAEMAGAAELIPAAEGYAAFIGGRLLGITMGSDGMQLSAADGESGRIVSLPLTGEVPPFSGDSRSFTLLWADKAGEYMIVNIGSVHYLISIVTGTCSRIVSGSGYVYCGAARVGNIITAAFCSGGNVYFYRRSAAGDTGSAPAITALDTYYEAGSIYDRVLNVCGGVFVMLKYRDGDSVLKVYEPAEMLCSAEFSTGIAGAYAIGGICVRGEESWFLLADGSGGRRLARCTLSCSGDFTAPALLAGGSVPEGCRVVAESEAGLWAAAGSALYLLSSETLEVLEEKTLPASLPAAFCAVNGAELGGLWGGRYIPAGGRLTDPEDMSGPALRCGESAPSGYAALPVAGRYFAAFYGSRWYLFDCLLRPAWGMVPYVTSQEEAEEGAAEADTSAFGTMSKA